LGNIYQEAAHVRQRRRVGDRLVDVYDPASTHAVTPAIMFNPDTAPGGLRFGDPAYGIKSLILLWLQALTWAPFAALRR
jgi:hypothetical protein